LEYIIVQTAGNTGDLNNVVVTSTMPLFTTYIGNTTILNGQQQADASEDPAQSALIGGLAAGTIVRNGKAEVTFRVIVDAIGEPEIQQTGTNQGQQGDLPDLVVQISLPSGLPFAAGQPISEMLSVMVSNIGSAIAPGKLDTDAQTGFGTDIYIASVAGPPPSQPMCQDYPVCTFRPDGTALLPGGRHNNTTNLVVGGSQDYTPTQVSINPDTPAGDYFICAFVDAGSLVQEIDETNNFDCAPIGVMGGPSGLGTTPTPMPTTLDQ
jgi:hypothetical protein